MRVEKAHEIQNKVAGHGLFLPDYVTSKQLLVTGLPLGVLCTSHVEDNGDGQLFDAKLLQPHSCKKPIIHNTANKSHEPLGVPLGDKTWCLMTDLFV